MIEVTEDDYAFTIDEDRRQAHLIHRGTLDGAHLVGGFRHMISRPEFRSDFITIIDYTRVARNDITAADLRNVAEQISDMDNRPIVATVVSGEDLGRYMLAKFYCTIAELTSREPIQRRAFRSVEEASEWLLAAAGQAEGSRSR